jgi:aerobic carbon-monoxide dehydrogenase large subunit
MGRRVPRLEDRRLLRGGARYVADIDVPGAAHVSVVRSPMPHGVLVSVDASEALRVRGVVRVVGAEELDSLGVGPIPVGMVLPGQRCRDYPALARHKVWYVGQPVAVVIADDPYLAEDAAARVRVEIDELPPVSDTLAALEDDAPLLNEAWGTNVAATHTVENGDVDRAFEEADVVMSERFRIHRHGGCPIETRGTVATYDAASDEVTAWMSTQSPHHSATLICEVCGWPEHKVRVIAPDVGGAFGTKEPLQAEELLVCVMARELGRPVRWIEDRREHFLSTVHSREQVWDVEWAATSRGRLLGVRGRLVGDMGGHLSNVGMGTALQAAAMFPGPYEFDNLRLDVVGVVTNKVPSGAYRGFGAPEAAFVMERLIDLLATETDRDRADLRRETFIAAKALPRRSATGHVYDSGDYDKTLTAALQRIDYEGFPLRREEARRQGRHLGIGIGSFVMAAGLAPSAILGMGGATIGGYESAVVRIDPTGKATVLVGTPSQGQGHATTLAQACADVIGLDPESDVVVRAGDSETTPYDPAGAIGSRVGQVAGAAVVLAARRVRDKLASLAAHRLEASEADIELADGRAHVRGSESMGVALADLARAAHLGHDLPDGMLPGLEARVTHEPSGSSYPHATHAAVVELDVDSGQLSVLRYVVANDSGTVMNPTIVEGQIRGGVAQALGGALLEHLPYDEDGQLLATSFMDYLLPSASEVPDIEIELSETAAPAVPGGMKGVGEAGAIAPMAVIGNAVADALGEYGVSVTRMPLDLDRVWNLAEAARNAARKGGKPKDPPRRAANARGSVE